MPRRTLALLALVLLAGCDAFGGPDGPGWTQTGARLVYDYTSGPDSLHYGFPRRALPATPAIIEMRVFGEGSYGGRGISWYTTDLSSPLYERYWALPLYGEDIIATERGVEVVIPRGCSGGLFGSVQGSTHYVRVPRVASDAQSYVPCSLDLSVAYRIAGAEMVVTPAGTFETFIYEVPSWAEGRDAVTREFWNYDAGLVRLDIVNADGVLRGRLMLASSETAG